MCNDMKTCLFAAYKNMIIDSHASFSFSEKKQEVPANILYVDQYQMKNKKKSWQIQTILHKSLRRRGLTILKITQNSYGTTSLFQLVNHLAIAVHSFIK